VGEGVTGLHPYTKIHHCGFENVGLQPPKLPKQVAATTALIGWHNATCCGHRHHAYSCV